MSKSDDKKLNQLTAEDLYEAIGGVDEELLARAEMDDAMAGESAGTGIMTRFSDEQRVIVPVPHDSPATTTAKRRKLRRYLPLVAAAVVMISLTGLWMTMRRTGMGSTAPAMQEAATEAPEAAMEEAQAEIEYEEADSAPADGGVAGGGQLGGTLNAPAAESAPAATDQKAEFGAEYVAEESAAEESAPLYDAEADSMENGTQAARSGSDEVETMRMQVSDGTHTVVFQLNDSPSAVSLYNQLPFDATVENYGSNEKIFTPPAALDKTDGIEGGGKAGGIAYFSPWGNIAMYYGNFSSYPGLYLLGEATSGAEQISALSGTVHFTAAE